MPAMRGGARRDSDRFSANVGVDNVVFRPKAGIRFGMPVFLVLMALVVVGIAIDRQDDADWFDRLMTPRGPVLWVIVGGLVVTAVTTLVSGPFVVGTEGFKIPFRRTRSWDEITKITGLRMGAVYPLRMQFWGRSRVRSIGLPLLAFEPKPNDVVRVVLGYVPDHVTVSDVLVDFANSPMPSDPPPGVWYKHDG